MLCPICGNETVISVNNELDRCTMCQGLFRKNPLEIDTGKLINEVYDSGWVSMRQGVFDGTMIDHAMFYEMILRFLKVGRGELLEIGSGTGEFLSLAKRSGWSVVGLEPSKQSCDFIKNELKIDVINSVWNKDLFNDKSFDVIFFAHVLEHINNPVKFLKEVKEKLKDDGIILFSVPNAKSIDYQNANINSNLYTERDHIFFYNQTSLINLACASGLKMKYITSRQTAGEFSRKGAITNKESMWSLIDLENNMNGYEIIGVLYR
ncbi:MAG: methyltransferase domain-containing protein [Clostridium sp.]|uniref:methyltransferase domain-containing protein n=1 Tax=Clostridium sp. TaxID=1506 RepID=UPI003F2C3C1C